MRSAQAIIDPSLFGVKPTSENPLLPAATAYLVFRPPKSRRNSACLTPRDLDKSNAESM